MKMNKYILNFEKEQTIVAQPTAWVAAAQLHHNKIALWILENERDEPTTRTFKLYLTGEIIDPLAIYVGTVQTTVVKTTYHIFEVFTPLPVDTITEEEK